MRTRWCLPVPTTWWRPGAGTEWRAKWQNTCSAPADSTSRTRTGRSSASGIAIMPHSNPTLRVVVPARFASSRLPGKPLLDLAGTPMVVRVYQAVHDALPDADVVVAVDDRRVLDVLAGHGIQAVMTDAGHESGTDRAAEVARLLDWSGADTVCNVQGDEPL